MTFLIKYDVMTMILMVSTLALVMSMVILFTKFHFPEMDGLGYWALGNTFISFGMLSFLVSSNSDFWQKIPSSMLIAFGYGLMISGLQCFFGKKETKWLPYFFLLTSFAVNFAFLHLTNEIRYVVIGNSLIYFLASSLSGLILAQRIRLTRSTMYGSMSFLFFLFAVLMLYRATNAIVADAKVFEEFSTWHINKETLLIGSLIHLLIIFGFVLMMTHRMAEKLRCMVAQDWLTGISTRRSLEESAELLEGIAKRKNKTLCVVMMDLDNFKAINDLMGHHVGDLVLKHFATITQPFIRAEDVFGRYGGEEFCIILLDITPNNAIEMAERIRENFFKTPLILESVCIKSTISIGIGHSLLLGTDLSNLFKEADLQLYTAKGLGRNRTSVSEDCTQQQENVSLVR